MCAVVNYKAIYTTCSYELCELSVQEIHLPIQTQSTWKYITARVYELVV
jgi:hypothetical protein